LLSEINVFLGGAILALFITLITNALQIYGVINVSLARALLTLAWIVAIVGVLGSMHNAPAKHLLIAGIVTGLPVGLGLIALERWAVSKTIPKTVEQQPHRTTSLKSSETALSTSNLPEPATPVRRFGIHWDAEQNQLCPVDDTFLAMTESGVSPDTGKYFEVFHCPKCKTDYRLRDDGGNPIRLRLAKDRVRRKY
jgi:hypothetical protein